MAVGLDRDAPGREAERVHSEQHPLWWSAVLHLLPGALLTAFIVTAGNLSRAEPLLALLLGIVVVIAPLELGYLALYAKRVTGSWSPLGAVSYRHRPPWRRLALLAVGLATWMIVLVAVAIAVLDQWLAETVFAWLPEALLAMAAVSDDGEAMSGGTLVAYLALFLLANGVVGPVTEELYFRGHLLPRIDRFGRGAPMLNTVLFTLYHFHTPWRYPVILLGYLPIAWTAWRQRSVWVGLAAHVVINNVFVLMMLAAYLGSR